MKKKALGILLGMTLLTVSACGTSAEQSPDTGTTNTDTADTGASNEADGVEDTSVSDTSVTNDAAETETADTLTEADESVVTISVSPIGFSVTYEETTEETTADDGTVLVTRTVQTPVLTNAQAQETADRINADMSAFLSASTPNSETEQWAREVYEDSYSEESGIPFTPYADDIYTDTKRMDDRVISYEITYYSYTGGAHGNYTSVGRSYDGQTGEPIVFNELSDDMEAFRSAASDYLTALAESPSYSGRLFPGTDRESVESVLFADNNWFFSNTGITFMSAPYALGPYAAGTIYFTIPYSDAADMGLKEEYNYTGNYTQERYYTYAYDEEGNPGEASGDTEYAFDLNGDGTDETIAFYGYLYTEDGGTISLYINGEQWGDTIMAQMDLTTGYADSTYVLYDLDPADSFVEIGVLFTDASTNIPVPCTHFFRYTTSGELLYLGSMEGYASDPAADFDTFVQ